MFKPFYANILFKVFNISNGVTRSVLLYICSNYSLRPQNKKN